MTGRAPLETSLGRGWVTFEGDDLSGIVLPGCARPSGSLDEEAPPAVEKLRQALVEYFNGEPAARPQVPALAERARTPLLRSDYRVVCGILPGDTRSPRLSRRRGRRCPATPIRRASVSIGSCCPGAAWDTMGEGRP